MTGFIIKDAWSTIRGIGSVSLDPDETATLSAAQRREVEREIEKMTEQRPGLGVNEIDSESNK